MLQSLLRVFALAALVVLCIAAIIKMPTFTNTIEDKSLQIVDAEKLKSHVQMLSENLIPRSCRRNEKLKQAATYITENFKTSNPNVYSQPYNIDGDAYSNIISEHGPNTKEIIIIGAHYDAYKSYPGADDNASGIAGLLELNRLLSKATLERRVLLIAYACEEPPHYSRAGMGSAVHASSLTDSEVVLMISLEMIGYFSDKPNSQDFPVPALSLLYPRQGNYIAVVGKLFTLEASRLKASINHATSLDAYSINAPTSIPGVDFSDHRSYWALNYPAVMVTDTAFYRNKNYHTPADTYEKLNYEKMAQVVYGVYFHVLELANKP